MSGSKCIRYCVTTGPGGIPFNVLLERNDQLLTKIQRLQGEVEAKSAQVPAAGRVDPGPGSRVRSNESVWVLVDALNRNQDVYLALAAESERLDGVIRGAEAQRLALAAEAREQAQTQALDAWRSAQAEDARRRAEQAAADSRRAFLFAQRLVRFPGDAVRQAFDAVRAIEDDPARLSPVDRRSTLDGAEKILAAAEAAAAGDAATRLKEAFESLGYTVGENFQTLAAAGDGVYAQGAGWPAGYACRAVLDRSTSQINLDVVREGGDASADVAAQQRLCKDLPQLLQGLHGAGTAVTLAAHEPPGVRPVARVDGLPFAHRDPVPAPAASSQHKRLGSR
jgi:hypothetical protein